MEEEIVKRFDMIFCTETTEEYIREKPVLLKIFNKLEEDLYIQDKEYDNLRKRKIDIESKLFQTFLEGEEKLYNELEDIENKMIGMREKTLFLYGFLMAKHIEKESRDF